MGSLCHPVTPTAWSCSLSPPDCATSSPDIHVCLPSQFKCTNTNRCIPGIFRCNGQDNCGDGEDEKDCREWGAQGVSMGQSEGLRSVSWGLWLPGLCQPSVPITAVS